MPRVRKHDRHLPPRMRLRSGTYYLVEQAHGRSRWHNLGRDYSEALRAWAEAARNEARVTTVDDLLAHYLTACVTRAAAGVACRWHDLRHTCASWLVQAGVPLHTVGEFLGHSSMAVTKRYAHLAPEHLAEAVNRLR
ncbi:MAG: tyrosine-type recombinase/integrase [Bradyrhizobium sp.]|nr:tyrosine-type recombinase/integrase [Bradyrhizobium sp.]